MTERLILRGARLIDGKVAAGLLGLGNSVGRIAPGYAADLLAVARDPAGWIEALDDPRLVMVEGKCLLNRPEGRSP